jgi:regulator of sirC expression with transglutaminase-like and TPR domain
MKETEIQALISLLDDEDKEVLAHVENKLLSLGESVIPILESEWERNFNPVIQKKIEDIIHSLQFENLKSRLKKWKEGGFEDLLEGMWLISTYQYPDLSLDKLKKEVEQLFYELWVEFNPDLHPFDQVKQINGVIFSKLRFSANTKNFHSPSNSMINMVLESKKGNPISLCVIYMILSQKLKLPVYGVNLPNLFILTYKNSETQFYINAFNKGLIFSKADIDNYIGQLNLAPADTFYQPCSHLDIIKRVLRNLVVSYEKSGNSDKVEEIKILLDTVSNGEEKD